ncbi:MAG: response regulator, partial [Alphaproteobacteria bacterium]|nr:response regulator [Alphaproteobacteria bacterium]
MLRNLNFEGLKFLVADAADNFRRIATGILRDFGATEIVESRDGNDVWSRLGQSQYDLLMCDASLPGIDGLNLTKKIRANENPHRYIPIVLLSSHTQQGNVERARDYGANLVVAKPISPRSLYSRLLWAAQIERAFIESATYCGPDRRFKIEGFPTGVGRRAEDNVDVE